MEPNPVLVELYPVKRPAPDAQSRMRAELYHTLHHATVPQSLRGIFPKRGFY